MKFYICAHCGKIINIVKDTSVPIMCCGQNMTYIEPGTSDASVEKHVPIYTIENNKVHVYVGSINHPMTPEHYIEWIALKTKTGYQINHLSPSDKAQTEFRILENDEVENVYAYCNLHSLWKS